ncbi:MAG: peptidylprolyl isomerase [Pseudomonadota bacterium]
MKKLVFTTALAMIFAFPVFAEDKEVAKNPAPKADYVILKVGDESIKKSEVETVWKSIFPGGNPPAFDGFEEKIKENVLRGIASEHIIVKEAEKANIKNSEEVKQRIAAAEKQITIQEFLKIKTKELVTDEKIKAVYDERVKSSGEEVHARHILVKTEAEAKEIAKKLKAGGKFEEIAKEKSQDKSNSGTGGDLGWFTADKMVPEFSKAAFALKKGEVSEPVKSDFGWHVIKLEDRRKATPASFDKMKGDLTQELGNKAVADYVSGIMKDVKVTIVDSNGVEKSLPPIQLPEKK